MGARGDMEFLFDFSTRYLTSEHSERVRYQVEHEKRNSKQLCIILFIL